MQKPGIFERAKIAYDVFRNGFPIRRSQQSQQLKASPLLWPDWREGKPEWKMINIEAYITEGFNANSLIYSAIMYKARASAVAPLRAYIGNPDNPELLPPEHPLAQLVARPNPHQSWVEFQQQNIVYENIAGNVFIFLDRGKSEDGLPEAMYSLRPDRTFIIPGNVGGKGFIKGFAYIPEGKSFHGALPIAPEDMIHIKLPNPSDPLEGMGEGLSPISCMAHSADVDNNVTSFLKMFFQRGVMVTGLLSYEMPLDDPAIARIRERWREIYGGYENWDIGILANGGSYQRVGLTFDEMGFEQLDERNETRILGPFGVPPILIGSRIGLARSTYANYKEAREAFWQDTFVPENALFESDFQYYLQSPDGGFVKFDYSNVPALQKAVPDLVNAWAVLVQNGISKDVAAEVVGLPLPSMPKKLPMAVDDEIPEDDHPSDDVDNVGAAEAEADDRIGKAIDNKEGLTSDKKKELAKAVDNTAVEWEPVYHKATGKAFDIDEREIMSLVEDAKKKSLQEKATINWQAVITAVNAYLSVSQNWQGELGPPAEGIFEDQALRWFAVINPVNVVPNEEYFNKTFNSEWFEKYKLQFAQPINDTTSKDISALLAQADSEGWSVDTTKNHLKTLFEQWKDGDLSPDDFDWLEARMPAYRREMIVRTESMRAANASSNKIFGDYGATGKEWLSAGDNRVRTEPLGGHVAADGQVVGINEKFEVGGEQLDFPGDPAGSPENTIQCRCVVLPRVGD